MAAAFVRSILWIGIPWSFAARRACIVEAARVGFPSNESSFSGTSASSVEPYAPSPAASPTTFCRSPSNASVTVTSRSMSMPKPCGETLSGCPNAEVTCNRTEKRPRDGYRTVSTPSRRDDRLLIESTPANHATTAEPSRTRAKSVPKISPSGRSVSCLIAVAFTRSVSSLSCGIPWRSNPTAVTSPA